MKLSKIGFLLAIIILLNSCASTYHMIKPNKLNYNSNSESNNVILEYKYDLLNKNKKYAKKETKKGLKIIAISITNNSKKDIVFGDDVTLTYKNGKELNLLTIDKTFKTLKQNSASYLLFLLLTPLKLYKSDGIQTRVTSIGFFIGPGIAGGNVIASSTANKNFKSELIKYDMQGVMIKKGETKKGLICVKSDSDYAIQIKVK